MYSVASAAAALDDDNYYHCNEDFRRCRGALDSTRLDVDERSLRHKCLIQTCIRSGALTNLPLASKRANYEMLLFPSSTVSQQRAGGADNPLASGRSRADRPKLDGFPRRNHFSSVGLRDFEASSLTRVSSALIRISPSSWELASRVSQLSVIKTQIPSGKAIWKSITHSLSRLGLIRFYARSQTFCGSKFRFRRRRPKFKGCEKYVK